MNAMMKPIKSDCHVTPAQAALAWLRLAQEQERLGAKIDAARSLAIAIGWCSR